MTGSRDTLPAPELPAEARLALVVATATYADPALRRLRSPARDAADLADLLADPDVGGFAVTPVIDRTAHDVRVAIEDFLADRDTADLLLVYLSCHGLLDARGRLHFAAADTVKSRLGATGVASRWLLEQMEDCRARRQVLILDCCFSGAFDRGAKGAVAINLGEALGGHSRGRVVLTASRATEYSFEGQPTADTVTGSVFTAALLEGIRTGEADINNDGFISVEEAYDFAFTKARTGTASQTPQRWVYGAEGDGIVLARSPAGISVGAAPLPDALRVGLDNPHPQIRLGAVNVLGEWLHAPDPARILAARQALHRIADTDIAGVAVAAQDLLEGQARTPVPRPRGPGPAVVAARVEPQIADAAERDLRAPLFEPAELEGLYADDDRPWLTGTRFAAPEEYEPSRLVARYLFPTERYRGEWKRHWIFLAKRLLSGVAAALLVYQGLRNLPTAVPEAVETLPSWAAYALPAAILAWTAWGMLTWPWYRFVITDKRILVVSGVIVRRVSMMPLIRLTDMKYAQSWLGQLLNYGTFRLESAGRMDRMRRIRDLPNPNELYLRVVEEMYEPGAVEVRLGDVPDDDA